MFPGLVSQFHFADAIFQPRIAQRTACARQAGALVTTNDQLLAAALAYNELLRSEQDLSVVNEIVIKAEQLSQTTAEFAKANKAYDESIKVAPSNVQDVYYNKGQLNRVIGTPASNAQAVLDYEGYVKTVIAKGDAEISKPAVKENLFDAYSFIGANYATTDKIKAIENFKKAAEINPADTFVKESLQALNK